jgi:hypothetical protein
MVFGNGLEYEAQCSLLVEELGDPSNHVVRATIEHRRDHDDVGGA